jgi:hypothetical protein
MPRARRSVGFIHSTPYSGRSRGNEKVGGGGGGGLKPGFAPNRTPATKAPRTTYIGTLRSLTKLSW